MTLQEKIENIKSRMFQREIERPTVFWNTQETIAFFLWLDGEPYLTSCFIDEDSITCGYGEIYSDGGFEYPLPNQIIKGVFKTLSWKEYMVKETEKTKRLTKYFTLGRNEQI